MQLHNLDLNLLVVFNQLLTDRRVSSGVVFVTGHAKPGGQEPPWEALARSGLTLVVYMGLQRAAAVAQALLSAGRCAHTPAAVVLDATLPTERHRVTTLEALANGELGEPSTARGTRRHAAGLLVIGQVLEGLAQVNACGSQAATMAACHAA